MNRLLSSVFLWALPTLALAQAMPPAMPAPTSNLPSPQAAPISNLPPPMPAPNPLIVPVAPMYLNTSQTFVSRGSTATYFDSTGTLQTAAPNTPRYDYDPVTHTAKGILVEPRRTNLLKSSSGESFWTKKPYMTIAGGYAAPDGTSSAIYISRTIPSVSGSYIWGPPSSRLSPGHTVAASVFAKAGVTSSRLLLRLQSQYPQRADMICDLSSGSVVGSYQNGFTIQQTSIMPLSNGWYRCGLVATVGGSPLQYFLLSPTRTSSAGGAESVDGFADDAYVWGWQLEVGNTVTSLISTTTSPATRAQDVYQQF